MLIPVVLSGGSGTRLWPMSRQTEPKQFLKLIGEYSLLQHTILRNQHIKDATSPLLVSNQDHYFLLSDQLREIKVKPLEVILEPMGRNTAPAIAIAAMRVAELTGEDSTLLVMPADHMIKEVSAFVAAVNQSRQIVSQGKLLTFGIKPTLPHTGYGYVESGAALSEDKIFAVKRFIEKPEIAQAQQYILSEQFHWNSGIFMFTAASYLAELQHHAPDIHRCCQTAFQAGRKTQQYYRLDAATFLQCRNESIDYAVMESTRNAAITPMAPGWSDIGDWTAIAKAHDTDEHGNVIQGDVIAENVKNSYLHSQGRLLAAIGVQDQIIVEMDDAVLVAHKNESQKVKSIVAQLRAKNHGVVDSHHRVQRPWGFYESLTRSATFQVKRISVKPGAKLSLQLHRHRAEHWVVVSGIAQVTRDQEIFVLEKNQSTYIPIGVKHRLANIDDKPLIVIEVQSGDYLGEDDIVRFDDVYGRTEAVEDQTTGHR